MTPIRDIYVQRTLRENVYFQGYGLHTGQEAHLCIAPAPVGHGIVFARSDLAGLRVPALWDRVSEQPLSTCLRDENGQGVATIEHLMAAFAGMGVHNALCTLDGPEVPILDGSAAPFVRAFQRTGLVAQSGAVTAIEILRPVDICADGAWARLCPARSAEMAFEIDFPDSAIGQQRREGSLAGCAVVDTLSRSRTFCRLSDVPRMRAQGLALGGSVENAMVVSGAQILSPGGARHADEAVRHKMLDAVGDLYTLGGPLLGRYEGHRAGHALTHRLVRRLMATPEAWRPRQVDAQIAARLPGAPMAGPSSDAAA